MIITLTGAPSWLVQTGNSFSGISPYTLTPTTIPISLLVNDGAQNSIVDTINIIILNSLPVFTNPLVD